MGRYRIVWDEEETFEERIADLNRRLEEAKKKGSKAEVALFEELIRLEVEYEDYDDDGFVCCF